MSALESMRVGIVVERREPTGGIGGGESADDLGKVKMVLDGYRRGSSHRPGRGGRHDQL